MANIGKMAKESVNKGAWSLEEDQILTNYIKIHGEGKWTRVAQNAGLKRCGKSCRLRWLNYLRPGIKRGDISTDEEDLIMRLHRLLGNRWALIAGRLPGRTDNEIKNYWNTILVKKTQGQESSPSIMPLKIEEKKSIEDCTPDTPRGIEAMVYHSPEEGKNLINICDGQSKNPTTPIEDDSTNFFMDIDVDKVLFQDVMNSDFLQIHHDKMHKKGNMIGENEADSSSSGCLLSANEIALENGIKTNSLETTLDVELKRVASFLDLEDEWRSLICAREEC